MKSVFYTELTFTFLHIEFILVFQYKNIKQRTHCFIPSQLIETGELSAIKKVSSNTYTI